METLNKFLFEKHTSMKSILLTGGTGFIGTNLINSFKNKFKICFKKKK